ncbi:PTS sugar transporter subunit IIA [Olsenella sp. An290]|uniref:PTS sugar transporter subunit IIA n=1 Tax=Olsenella sp. An290 TaxID=1965625 RepID=UPI000B388BBF|nr:PTS sugar transporter subunit IIA [Olsenella sp. An290]OUO35925.1 PTS fructose transporter subunit IIA [Olsenella sp. An290]
MIGFILTGHGHFSNGLKSAVDMVAGPQQSFEIVPFEEAAAGEYASKLRDAITAMRGECDGVLVFVDLVGGTPFNQSMMVSNDVDNVAVVAGTNLPMLIDIVMARSDSSTLSDLVAEAVEVGKEGVCHMSLQGGSSDDEDDEM